jgi:hypothetical protein
MKLRARFVCFLGIGLASAAAGAPGLDQGFSDPPASARPWAYWTWMNGSVTKEGIRADLEDMKRVGIGGVMFFDGNLNLPTGPIRYGSETWHEHVQYTLAVADELGLQVAPMICAGWATSGGPWNDAAHSMKRLVWTEQPLAGKQHWRGTLPSPPAQLDYYRDIAVLAVPGGKAPRVANLDEKTGLKSEPRAFDPKDWSRGLAGIPLKQVMDLTEKLGPDGVLSWDVPEGQWCVLRFGYTTTGARNHPAPAEGEGLEVDKFDRGAVEAHFEHALGRIIRDAGPHAGRSLAGVMADSWEAGAQNWTAALPEFFRERRGYAIRSHLPALAGRVLDSPARTEAFLADFRRTLGELYAENYFRTLQRKAHEHGLRFFSEAYGGVFDETRAIESIDVPMMEFWAHGLYKGFDHAPAVAHFEGKPVVMAEAFTARPPHAQWTEHPFLLKALGDAAFTAGANALALHCYIHQPRSDIAPGFTLGRYGVHFGRLNSWWPLAPAWVDYLKRCQFLLQQGQPVADLLVLQPERLQSEHRELTAPVVPGYQSDLISVSQLERLAVRQGLLQSPGGATYRLLLTPAQWVATTATLRQLERLVAGGATVAGSPPLAPATLPDLESGYADWQRLVEKLWHAPADRGPAEALARLGVAPDFRARSAAPGADVRFAHRTGPGFDLYFVSNQTRDPADLSFNERQFRYTQTVLPGQPVRAELEFRVAGRLPELWDPASGRRVRPAAFSADAARTRMELSLAAAESVFVVFRQPLPAAWPVEIVRAGQPLPPPAISALEPNGAFAAFEPGEYQVRYSDGRQRAAAVAPLPEPLEVGGPWRITFQPGRGAPPSLRLERLAPLNASADFGVRHFSGLADYAAAFDVPPERLAAAERVWLDLGEVHDLAAVTLDGRAVAVLWKPPFVVDVTALLRPGRNELAVRVANRWVNRLIGDETLPPDARYVATVSAAGPLAEFPAWWNDPAAVARRQRITFATWKALTAESPLLSAGLLGPVRLRFAHSVQ